MSIDQTLLDCNQPTFIDIRCRRVVEFTQRCVADLNWELILTAVNGKCILVIMVLPSIWPTNAHRSKRHVWHTFLILAQVVQISVFLNRAPDPGFQRKTVNGRTHIWGASWVEFRTESFGWVHQD